jgi:putative acetyltransferase
VVGPPKYGRRVIRPERPDDADAIARVVGAAFGGDDEVRLVATMRDRGELVYSLVAEEDGEVVGHIALSEVVVDDAPAQTLGLAPVAVTPARQGDGIGAALIGDALRSAADDGWRAVVLLGHASYYPRFGFAPAAPQGLTGDYGDHDSWMARSLVDGRAVPTGHARYCSAFAEL